MGELEVNQSPIRFTIFTRKWDDVERKFVPDSLKAFRDDKGRMRLNGVASSTVKDLHGDNMLQTALEDMENAANNNLTIFGNHSYDVPEDVYGSVVKAGMRPANVVDAVGDPIWDLSFDIVVNEVNPRAVKTWEAIENGTKLGLSIGAMIPEGGAVRDKKSGAFTIAHVELLETSIVGIPANPRSWVQNAVKSIVDSRKSATTTSLGTPELTLDTDSGTYHIKGQLADIDMVSMKMADGTEVGVSAADIPEDAVMVTKHEACGQTVEGAFPDGICTKCGETGPFLAEYIVKDAIEATTDPEVADAATCPDCGKGGSGDGCKNPYHDRQKDVDPEVTDAKVTLIQIDTGDEGSSATSEPVDSDDPDDEYADATALVEEVKGITGALDAPVAGMIQSLLEVTNGLLTQLTESKNRERQALSAKAAAERERDAVVGVAGDLISKTNDLIKRLGDLRVGPKTLIREATDEADDLRGIYTEAFLDLLHEKNEGK